MQSGPRHPRAHTTAVATKIPLVTATGHLGAYPQRMTRQRTWTPLATRQDQHFAYNVTHDDDAPEFKILDFAALKEQAMLACQLRTNGARALDATKAVQDRGGYTFQQANAIASSAVAVYCSSVIPPPPGR